MIYLDGFSGIGGFHLGLVKAGFKFSKTYYSEIDKYAIGCYKRNFPESEYAGAINNLKGIRKIDVFTFGFPCQDISISGNGEGLKGKRSGLFFEAIEIIKKYKPSLFIFENVKNLLSSNDGQDFEVVLRTIADIGLYECEWQLLNTRWVLPQNRERIYFIGHLAEPRGSFSKVFPIRDTHKKIKQSEESKQGVSQIAKTLMVRDYPAWNGNYLYEIQMKARGNNNGSSSVLCPTITTSSFEHNATIKYRIPEATKKGYAEATMNDAINFSAPNSKTRRGRVSKIAHTIDTQANQGIIDNKTKLRRLTEIECERLQGFPDDWTKYGIFNEVVKEISAAQRYKMCGNAVTTKIVKLIGKKLLNKTTI